MNLAIDEMADEGYTDTRVPETIICPYERKPRFAPYMRAEGGTWAEVTGCFRPQILEEIKIQDTKKEQG